MSHLSSSLRTRLSLLLLAIVAILLARPASTQVAADERKCIEAINDGARKVAQIHNKEVRACMQKFAKGQLTPQTVAACSAPGVSSKVAAIADRALARAAGLCGGNPPPFGPPSHTAFPGIAVQTNLEIANDLFGPVAEDTLLTSNAGRVCQDNILKTVQACEITRFKEFRKCKSSGLKAGIINDTSRLQDVCLGTGTSRQPDPKNKILIGCELRPINRIAATCVEKGVDLQVAVPFCSASNPTDLLACLNDMVACRVCNMANSVDGLSRDCDLLDNATDDDSCPAASICGDGVQEGAEACDDGNTTLGDGCNAICQVDEGYECDGEPSDCDPVCGDGDIIGGETCDDGDASSGDGCSSSCQTESGYVCTGEPSSCNTVCGDGLIRGGEACDDADTSSGDGCSSTCSIESGFSCVGAPSNCSAICGDGLIRGSETCDDSGIASGDGCSATCSTESGYSCTGAPSTCVTVCGDGIIRGTEVCDDGDATSGDGCSSTCQPEGGFNCTGQPSNCIAVCGDGIIRGAETCDDGGTTSGNGCSATCSIESGYVCAGQPSVCNTVCGDGLTRGAETCDDGGTTSGNGCSSTCQLESGYSCSGQPSVCATVCGDGLIRGSEACDDGDTSSGDGCNATCGRELGWVCSGQPSVCAEFDVVINSPTHGSFTTQTSRTVTGQVVNLPPAQAQLTINGASVSIAPNGSFTTTVPISAAAVMNPIRATVVDTTNSARAHDRVVVIYGESVADGDLSPASVALRLNDTGLDDVEPLVADLAGDGLDLAALLPVGTVLINNQCFVNSPFGCLGRATVRVAPPPPSIAGFGLAMDSKIDFVEGNITVNDIDVNINIDGSGVVPDCSLNIHANAGHLNGDYALQPLPGDPSTVDVNQVGPLDVTFDEFQDTFTSGLCDTPVIGDIIQAFLPDIEDLTVDAMTDFLSDPDGAGPQDSPTAGAIETALAGISITGPVGEGLGVMLDAPLFDIDEDNAGITLGSDSSFTTEVGSGPGQCIPPMGAPNLTRSLSPLEMFPSFGANAPVSNLPYDLAIAISSAGFNQLLKAQTECGLLVSSINTLDLGTGPIPLNAGLLSLIAPQFAQFPAATPFRIDIRPTLAPVVTGNPGPAGELAELKIAQVLATIVRDDGSNQIALIGAFDVKLGLELDFAGGELGVTLSPPATGDITIAVIHNPLGVAEGPLETTILPPLVGGLLPSLAGGLAGFPIPSFLDLNLEGVEVSRSGQFLSLFTNLVP